jgi:hypothetical protein
MEKRNMIGQRYCKFLLNEETKMAPLRIRAKNGTSFEDYVSKLIRLIPAPALGIYLTAKGFIPVEYLGWWALVCLGVVILFSVWGTHDNNEQPPVQWKAVVIAAIAYIIWVYAMGDHLGNIMLPASWIASVAVILWSGLLPLFYRGDALPIQSHAAVP